MTRLRTYHLAPFAALLTLVVWPKVIQGDDRIAESCRLAIAHVAPTSEAYLVALYGDAAVFEVGLPVGVRTVSCEFMLEGPTPELAYLIVEGMLDDAMLFEGEDLDGANQAILQGMN